MKPLYQRSGSSGRREFPYRLALFGAAGAAALAYGFLLHTPYVAGQLVQRYGYYVMAVTFAWWLTTLWQTAGRLTPALARAWAAQHRLALGLAGLFALLAALTLPYSYKILYDELVLQATASNVHLFREFGTITRGYDVEGVFRSVEVYVDKRPFFYPFVVSLLHDFTGYREINGQILNTLLLPVSLILLYVVMKRMFSARAALVGMALFGSSSLLAQNANGHGMELLNLAMLLLTMLLATEYLAAPRPAVLAALVLSAVLLAQTRYESALYVVPTAVVVLEGWRRRSAILLPPAAMAAPLLLVPCALHNVYLSGMPILWELREDATTRFSFHYLANNLHHAGTYFFDLTGEQLNAWWLAALGLPAVLVAAYHVTRNWRAWTTTRAPHIVAILFGAALATNFWVLMFYYWGQLDDPIVARLILPFNVLLTLAVTWAFTRLHESRQPAFARALITGSLICYVAFGLRATAHNLRRNELASEIAWEEQWVAARPQQSRLMITNKSPLSWLVRKISAISVTRARGLAEQVQFHLANNTFAEALVSQYYRPTGPDGEFQLDPRDELPASFVLEPVMERRIGMRLLRISRVTAIVLPARADGAAPANAKPGESSLRGGGS